MKKLNELLRRALKVSVFYYYESDVDRWVVDYMFYMPRNEIVSAEELNLLKYYKSQGSAVRKAKQLALNFDGKYEGRIYDMEN